MAKILEMLNQNNSERKENVFLILTKCQINGINISDLDRKLQTQRTIAAYIVNKLVQLEHYMQQEGAGSILSYSKLLKSYEKEGFLDKSNISEAIGYKDLKDTSAMLAKDAEKIDWCKKEIIESDWWIKNWLYGTKGITDKGCIKIKTEMGFLNYTQYQYREQIIKDKKSQAELNCSFSSACMDSINMDFKKQGSSSMTLIQDCKDLLKQATSNVYSASQIA